MFEIFTTREIVIGLYLLLFMFACIIYNKMRVHVINMVKILLSKLIRRLLLLVAGYTIFLVYCFSHSSFWKSIYIKDVVIWFLIVGVPILFTTAQLEFEDHYFIEIVKSNLRLTILVELIVSTFTFSLWIEFFLLPMVTVLYLMLEISSLSPEYKPAEKLLNWIFSIIGLTLLYYSLKIALQSLTQDMMIDLLASFSIPLVLSVFFVPISYLLSIYIAYDSIYSHLKFRDRDSKKIRLLHLIKIMRKSGISIRKVKLFKNKYIYRCYTTMTEVEFEKILEDFATESTVSNHGNTSN